MSDLSDRVATAFRAGGEAEAIALMRPDNIEKALEAAEHLANAAKLSEEQAHAEECDEEVRKVASVLSLYYWAESHKNRCYYQYEKRRCDEARAELESQKSFLTRAVSEAERIVSGLPEKWKTFLLRQLESWRYFLEATTLTEYAIRARDAWEGGRTTEVLDWNRHSTTEAHRLLELADRFDPRVNPTGKRVARTNALVSIANVAQFSARHLVQRAERCKLNLYDLRRDEGLRFLGYLLEVHDAGAEAVRESPDHEHLEIRFQEARRNLERLLRNTVSHWRVILVRFPDSATVNTLMMQIDSKAYAMAKENRVLQQNSAVRLWAVGSFWLFALAVIGGVVALLGSVFNTWLVVVAIVGAEVLMVLIGAFVLRTTEDLTQSNFLKLVEMATRLQFHSLLALFKKSDAPSKTTSDPDD